MKHYETIYEIKCEDWTSGHGRYDSFLEGQAGQTANFEARLQDVLVDFHPSIAQMRA